ncbi:MAG: hypothetical protein ABIZ36_02910 [Gemmatimonadaceae bacterium]
MAAKKKANKMISATDLRTIAENADGTRGEDVYIEAGPGTLKRIAKPPAGRKPATGRSIIVARTEWNGNGLRGTGTISVTGCKDKVPKTADAVFTSQSSFEKFALPYYVRTMPIPELKKMLSRFYRKGVVCIYHEPGSDSHTASGRRTSGLRILFADGKVSVI